MKKSLLFFLLIFSLSVNAQEIDTRGAVSASNTTIAKGQTWAIVVGISDYLYLPKLQFAHRDAEIFAGYLIDEQKVPADNVRLYLNNRATANNVVSEFKQILEKVKTGDKVYFYFAGHGDNETVKGKEFSVLLLHGIKERDYVLGNDYIEMQLINQWITDLRLKGASTIFIADACHSGANLLVGGISGTQSTQQALKDVVKAETKLLSCQVGQLSLEGKQWSGGRGNFSYHLISGLMGLADGYADDVKDGIIKYDELENYLIKEVNKEARPNSQKPEIQTVSEEMVAVINKEKLQKYISSQKTSMSFFTKVNTKGSEEYLLKALDSTTRGIYSKFELCLNTKLLITPETNCANYYLGLVDKNEQNERIIAIMKRNLVAALQEDGNKLLTYCFQIGALGGETTKSLVQKDSLLQMIKYFEKSNELLKGNYLEGRINARKEFLEMLYLTYDKGTMLDGRKISLAISKLKKSLEKEPDVFYTLTSLAHFYATRQITDSCIYYYKKCLELDPHFLMANDMVANQYLIKGDTKNSRPYFENHILERPKSTFGYSGLAKLFQLEGDKTKAIEYFEKAHQIDKLEIQSMVGIIENSLTKDSKQKKFSEFISEIKKDKLDKKKSDFALFDLYWAVRDTLKAREIALKYVKLRQTTKNEAVNKDTNHLSFADESRFLDFYFRTKDCKGTETIFKNYILDNPTDSNPYKLLGSNYLLYCNDPQNAEKYFLEAFNLDSSNYSSCGGLCDFYSQQIAVDKRRDIDKAILFGEKALKIYDGEFPIYFSLAVLYGEKGDFKKAVKFYKKGITLQEMVKTSILDMKIPLASNYQLLSNCYDELNMIDSAVYFVKKAIEINPKDPLLYLSLGTYYSSLGNYDAAINPVLYAHNTLDSTNKLILHSIGLYYYVLNNFKASNQYYLVMEKYLKKFFRLPNGVAIDDIGPSYLNFMSNNYAYLGDFYNAEKRAKSYIELEPNQIAGYSALALTQRLRKMWNEALDLGIKMIELNPKDFRGYSNNAKVYSAQNDVKKALEWTEKALQNGMTRPIDYDRLTKTDDEWAELRLNSTFQSLINTYFKKK